MESDKVTDYPSYRELAARMGVESAGWAKMGIEHRTEAACRAEMARIGRAERGRYARLLSVEVARATASRTSWEACAREAERWLTAAEEAYQRERRWPALQAEIERRKTTTRVQQPARRPSLPVRQRRPAAATPVAVSMRPQPAAVDPREQHANHLESEGLHFAAQAERRAIAEADHSARRRRVEEEVARTERLFSRLRDSYGEAEALRYLEGA